MPIYQQVLEQGKKGDAIFLDIGCCSTYPPAPTDPAPEVYLILVSVGTDVRHLVYEGYPASKIVGSDLYESFISLGYELFRDKETNQIKFIAGNILDVPPSPPGPVTPSTRVTTTENVSKLEDLAGSATFIYIGSVFHFFTAVQQKAIVLRLLHLWTCEPGAIIFGSHQGLDTEGNMGEAAGRPEWYVLLRMIPVQRI